MKALVVGGSNGIGLAITKNLINQGYYIVVLDRVKPDEGILPIGSYKYEFFDLLDMNIDILINYANDNDLNVLIITAGIGRVADFEFFHAAEIHKIMTINSTATIEIISHFYNRIKSKKPFFCGVMGSIAGLLISPLAAVYAASKAAIFRFIESVNIELEMQGIDNRILNVSPASFKGSRFYGGNNQLELLDEFANQIVEQVFASKTLFIPEYENVLKNVLERYHNNPHDYGIDSYNYKTHSGRLDNNRRVIIGYLSGTFDLFHVGHLNLIKRAKQECDFLIVGVHKSGAWKGKQTFIPFDERIKIVSACKYVDKVTESTPEDSDAWYLWNYNKLFVGSDYKGTERFKKYEDFFKDKNVDIIYFPYTQSTNSTHIRNQIMEEENNK